MKDIRYRLGISIVVLTCVACVFSYYLLIIGIPLFLVGAILIFISRKPFGTKVLATLLPVILWIPATFLFLYFYNKTTPETYLIPEGFVGKIRIIYGEGCGVEPGEENGRRLLVIPENGVLIIRPEFEAGTVDHEYYYINRNGERTRLPETLNGEGVEKNDVAVFLNASGNIGGPMPDGSFSSESPLSISFIDLVVGHGEPNPYGDSKYESRFDSLAESEVERCRRGM